jgi:hypothetical protein
MATEACPAGQLAALGTGAGGRRHLVNNALFLWRMAGQLLGLGKYPIADAPSL